MRAVRQAGTKPELEVRAVLESLGVSYRLNVHDKPGRPDIWVVQNDIPIFVHGCYWHRHDGCKKATMPKSNQEYWIRKFGQNKERDARKMHELILLGYDPVVIWQCQSADESTLRRLVTDILQACKPSRQ